MHTSKRSGKLLHYRLSYLHWVLLLVVSLPTAGYSASIISSFKATPSKLLIGVPTTVKFYAFVGNHIHNPVTGAEAALITASPTLHKKVGAQWVLVGRIYDDGTHGDPEAGDQGYHVSQEMNEPSPTTNSYRLSAAYKGVLKREFSATIDIPACPPASLQIETGSDHLAIMQGSSTNVATVLRIDNPYSAWLKVINSVAISPNDGGVTFTTDYPVPHYYTKGGNYLFNQRFYGVKPGLYTVTNTASIQGASPPVSVASQFSIKVIPPGGDPIILPLGSSPGAVKVGASTDVIFTAMIADQILPASTLSLRFQDGATNPVIGTMVDDGTGNDLAAGDAVYTATSAVNAPVEGKMVYFASGSFPGVAGVRYSDSHAVIATLGPTDLDPSDYALKVQDPASGNWMLSNEVLVGVVDGTSWAEIQSIASSVDGTAVGGIPEVNTYQIRITSTGAAAGVFAVIDLLAGNPAVARAGPNWLASVDTAVTPNDTDFGFQWGLTTTRADEAWILARGGVPIAIVDSGVDYNHPDLIGKVIRGWNFIANNNDPWDDMGHGTHVAGIAAANTNNSVGMAGMSWSSRILAEKVIDHRGDGGSAVMALGIRDAAGRGVRVINTSFRVPAWDHDLMIAARYAEIRGCLIVASAGNQNTDAFQYPAAYDGVLAVGATDVDDNRAIWDLAANRASNYGNWVDIAAPGTEIWSTANNFYEVHSGTSQAAPSVAGAAAVVWQKYPSWTAAQVSRRLRNTAKPLPGQQLGSGRLDLFDAVFNGSFEDGMEGWTSVGTASAVTELGTIRPMPGNGRKMGMISSGPSSAQVQSSMEQSIVIQPGVTSITVSFDYDFVTEEYPEYVGRGFNDNMRIEMVTPSGYVQLAYEDVNTSHFLPIWGIDFPGGDDTVGHTGWVRVTKVIPVTQGAGVYRLKVRDEGDGIYDSVVLIDNIRFE